MNISFLFPSQVLDSQGTFKYHHDTDRDLKFVHVFPRVELKKGEDQSEKGNKEGEELSPEEQVTFCDFERFKPLVEKNVTSLSQKRELHKHLKRMQQVVEASEKKLSDMQELKEEESDIYHNAQDLPEKIEWLSKQMEKMVANGELTAQEKSDVQRQFKEKEEEIASEVERAKGEGKKADKRESQLNGLREKMANLSATDPKERKVKDESELIDCVSRLRELESLEKNMGKELYSLETVNKLKQKPELEKKIDSLKRQNVGWFEDASWLDRHIEKALKSRSAGKGRKNPDSSSSSSGRGSKNPDPSWNNAKRSGSHSKASSQRRAKPQDSGNPFAGLTD